MEPTNTINPSQSSWGNRSILRKEIHILLILVLVSFIVRLGIIFYFKTFLFSSEYFPSEDIGVGFEMGWIASRIAAGEGFKLGDDYTAWMAPIYPYILAFFYRIFDYASLNSRIAILVFQSLISALIAIPLYLLGKRLFNWQVGLLAALFWVFHPASILVATSNIWSTNLTALGLILIVVLFLKLHDNPGNNTLALTTSLVIGLTALSDPVILLAIPFMAIWLYWRSDSDRNQRVKQVTIVALVAILMILPWTLRNYLVFNQFVAIKANFGINLWLGNHNKNISQPTAGMWFWNKLEDTYGEQDATYLASLNEVELDKIMLQRAIDFISENPTVFAKYSLYRAYLFWRMTEAEHGTFLDRILLFLPVMTLIGILLSKQNWRDTALLLSVFVSFPLIYYITHNDVSRYRFPIEGLMLVFIAFLVYKVINSRNSLG